MTDNRPVKVILKGQAKEEFEELNKLAGEQQAKGIANSGLRFIMFTVMREIIQTFSQFCNSLLN